MRCEPGGEVPAFVGGHGGYPERDVEAAVPYERVRTRRKKGKCGARGEVTGSEKVGAAICRPPTPDHNRRKRAAG